MTRLGLCLCLCLTLIAAAMPTYAQTDDTPSSPTGFIILDTQPDPERENGTRTRFLRYDLGDGSLTPLIDFGRGELGCRSASPDGAYLFYSFGGPDAATDLHLLEIETGAVTVIPSESRVYCAGWSPDGGQFLYFENDLTVRASLLHRYDLDAGTSTHIHTTEDLIKLRPVWFTDGSGIGYAEDGGNRVYRYDLATGEVREIMTVDTPNFAYYTDPRTDVLVIYVAFAETYLYDPANDVLTHVTADIPDASIPSWTDNLTHIAFGSNAQRDTLGSAFMIYADDIIVYTVATGAYQNITNTPAVAETVGDWGPDNVTLLYTVVDAETLSSDLYTYNLNTGETTQLTDTEGVSVTASMWSPAGTHVAFATGTPDDADNQPWSVVTVPDGEITPVPDSVPGEAAQFSQPAWTPDGSALIYTGGDDLYVFDVVTGEAQRITETPDLVEQLHWFADNERTVVFSARSLEDRFSVDLYLLDAATGTVMPLTDLPGEERIILSLD